MDAKGITREYKREYMDDLKNSNRLYDYICNQGFD